ncbi:elongation factor 1-beta-like isoform X1 [Tasmannia lanceolata]|uniref:elongation factor 1-beta-like isoform X1 n=1 Tax=Tasmannia lanceolata TaxID=3420 RepID=UPI0040639F04
MAISFSDLHAGTGIKSLNEYLEGKTYVSGDEITRDDIKVFAAVLRKPGGEFPNACSWYESVSSQLAARFPGEAVGVIIAGQAAPPASAPAEEATKELGIKKCEYFRWCQNDVDDNEFCLRRDNMIANQRLQRLESEVAVLKVLVQQGREAIKVVENEAEWIKVMGVVVFFLIFFIFYECSTK